MWNNLNNRAGNRMGTCPAYANVEVRMTRDEFTTWAIPALEAWMAENPGKQPSLDRMDSKGHYELGNIQIRERLQNIGDNGWSNGKSKSKRLTANRNDPVGHAWCSGCQAFRPVDQFARNKTRHNGLQKYCQPCRQKQRAESTIRSRSR